MFSFEDFKELAIYFDDHSVELRIVGGYVRDTLLGYRHPKDIDLAAKAPFNIIVKLLKKHNNCNKIEEFEMQGVVKFNYKNKPVELAMTRVDTYKVSRFSNSIFVNDWATDSYRRDFTINTLSMDYNGQIYDYCNGSRDIKNRKLFFVREPAISLAEDPVRALRYWRFITELGTEWLEWSQIVKIDSFLATKETIDIPHKIGKYELNEILKGLYLPDILNNEETNEMLMKVLEKIK